MTTIDKQTVGATLLVCASTLALPAVARAADAAAANQGAGVEEIVVTARRKEERLLDVPAAVSAIGAEDLQNLRIDNFGQVGQTVPNLNIQQQFGSASSPQVYLRGVATGSLKFQTDAGVALYIDGVYLGRPAATAFDIADIERIEVLRGPQGTLFGRNSTGGAVNIVTAVPTGTLGGTVDVTGGNYNQRRGKLTLNLPEVAGFSTRLTYLHSEHDGYVKHTGPANTYNFSAPFGTLKSADDFGNDDTDAISLAVRYSGGDRLTLDYKFDYADKDSSQLGVQLLGQYGFFNPSFDLQPGANITHVDTRRRGSLPIDTSQTRLKVQGHSLTGTYNLSDQLTVKNILSYREFHEDPNFNDIDGNNITDTGILSPFLGIPGPPFVLGGSGAPFAWISAVQERAQHQWTDEFQLLGTVGNLDWIAGAFFFDEGGWDNNPVLLFTPLAPGAVYTPGVTNSSILGQADYAAGADYRVDNSSTAGFVHGTYRFTDQWEVSGGARYTRDDREETLYQAGTIAPPTQRFKKDFDKIVWDMSLTYKIQPDVNVYGKVSTGYLTGGTIGGGTFEPETITSYEVGLKSGLFDDRLTLNLAAFHAERKDLQVVTFSPAAGTQIANGGKSQQDGVELETRFEPADGLRLYVNYGYVNDSFDLNVRSLSPKHTAAAGVDYDFHELGNGSVLTAHVDASWRSDTTGLTCPVGASLDLTTGCTNLASADMALDRQVEMKASTLLGARLTYGNIQLGSATASVSLWGRNLLDEKELEFVRDLSNGTVMGTFQIPATYGLDVKVNF
jgi:iron complex outermembrane receptor protein